MWFRGRRKSIKEWNINIECSATIEAHTQEEAEKIAEEMWRQGDLDDSLYIEEVTEL